MQPTRQQIAAALGEILRERGIKQRKLADSLHLSESMVSRLLAGAFPLDRERLAAIARAIGIVRPLLEDEIKKVIEENSFGYAETLERLSGTESREQPKPSVDAEESGVPVLTRVAAGISNHTAEYTRTRRYVPISTSAVGDDAAFALEVVGDSMCPDLVEGDVVVCSPRAQWHDGDICFVEMRDRSDTVKRVYRLGDGRIELRPMNPRHRTATESDSEEHGRVLRVVRAVGRYSALGPRQ